MVPQVRQAESREAARARQGNAVEWRSVALFFALLPTFIATLALRAQILAVPSRQPVVAAASAVHPATFTVMMNPASRF
jgi:hypothetical protein